MGPATFTGPIGNLFEDFCGSCTKEISPQMRSYDVAFFDELLQTYDEY